MIRARVMAGAMAACVLGALTLTGCTAATPLPTVTVTAPPSPAPTVTARPPVRTASSPLTAIDAWAICVGFLGDPSQVHLNSFSPQTVAESNGVFRVQTVGTAPDKNDAGAACTISGTAGDPKILDWHTPE